MKLYLTPNPTQIERTNGVGAVVHAQFHHLPNFGIEFVATPYEADIIACHVAPNEALPRVDVLMNHGMYFDFNERDPYRDPYKPNNRPQYGFINRKIAEAARQARAITVPSEWAAEPFKRDMRLSPTVIPNGVDLELWEGKHPNGHYVLWNKNRAGDVCDPGPAYELAKRGVSVVSTFVPADINQHELPGNLRVTGSIPFAEMRQLVLNADVYLATTQEIDSLSVKEAMAAGVPVLGFRWGGTAEVVRHKQEGYLVEPGDIGGLLEGLEWIRSNRDACSKAARERAQAYSWPKIIEKYARLYGEVYQSRRNERHRVSVVLTSFNYAGYLAQALESVLGQTKKPDEVVVVDDGSTDNTAEIARNYADRGVKLIRQENQGVANARNAGIAATNSEFVICLDADDALHPRYIEALLPHVASDRALGVVWSKAALTNEQLQPTGQVWDFNFKWEEQAHPDKRGAIRNGIPCAAMFRREMWERAGGYRQIYHPAEDAEFWLRGLSVGFTARRVSDEALFYYRTHEGSASQTKAYPAIHSWHPWSRDRLYPFAAPSEVQAPVRSYARPLVSVIIPVLSGNARYLPGAIDSLLGQSIRDWEAIVVDDTEEFNAWQQLKPYPFARLEMTEGGKGIAAALNMGLKHAKAPLVLFLDASGYLMPLALEKMVKLFAKGGGRYVYSDLLSIAQNGETSAVPTPEYDPAKWLSQPQHSSAVLMATADARHVGGFDESFKFLESWAFFAECARKGIHGMRLPEVLIGQRIAKREFTPKQLKVIAKEDTAIRENGELIMACCGARANTAQELSAAAAAAIENAASSRTRPGYVALAYTGKQTGAVAFMGAATGTTYFAGNNPFDRVVEVKEEDVYSLTNTGKFIPASQIAA